MKKLLLLLFLLPTICIAQKSDSLIQFKTSLLNYDSLAVAGIAYSFAVGSGISYDIGIKKTIKCIMLLCDTSRKKIGSYFKSDSIQPKNNGNTFTGHWITEYGEPNHSLTWQIGYEIHDGSLYISYLDADKKPLSKNIIVWISQPLNK